MAFPGKIVHNNDTNYFRTYTNTKTCVICRITNKRMTNILKLYMPNHTVTHCLIGKVKFCWDSAHLQMLDQNCFYWTTGLATKLKRH